MTRQISAKQREWLSSELDSWQSQQLVSAEQAGRILDQYESASQLVERRRSVLLLTLMGVAALLVGLAVLLLVGYNWSGLSVQAKLSLIFGALLATHGVAFWLRYRLGMRELSEVAFCIAGLIYGAAIFLIAQVFHLSGHAPDAVWWWAIGVLPFAVCLESVLLHALLVALLAIWCGMEVLGFGNLGMWFFGRWGWLPNGAFSLPLLALPGLVWAYRRRSLATIWMYVALVAWWAVIQPLGWRLESLSIFWVGIVAALLMMAAESHEPGSRFAAPYRRLGLLLTFGVLLALSFYDFGQEIYEHRWIPWRAERDVSSLSIWVLLTLAWSITAAALVLAPAATAASPNQAPAAERMAASARRRWLPIGLLVLMTFFVVWWFIQVTAILPTVLANVAMIVVGFWLINAGLQRDEGRMFATGVLYLLLWVVMRYIDLFGDFGGMLGAAGMFFVCGLTLFGVAWFWRHRGERQHA